MNSVLDIISIIQVLGFRMQGNLAEELAMDNPHSILKNKEIGP